MNGSVKRSTKGSEIDSTKESAQASAKGLAKRRAKRSAKSSSVPALTLPEARCVKRWAALNPVDYWSGALTLV